MKRRYKILTVFLVLITLFCSNNFVYAADSAATYVYSPWEWLNSQSNWTEFPQLFHVNYNTGTRVSFQGNSSSGLFPSQYGLVTTVYKPGDVYDQTTGLWMDTLPGMTLNTPEAFIDVIDASQIGINMFYNNGNVPNFMSPPKNGHVAYKMDVLFRWIYDKGHDPNQSMLQFDNAYLFGYTTSDRSQFDTFGFADVPYDWSSGEFDRYTNFYQRVFHFEFVMPLNVTKAYYGFMFKVVGRFKDNYLHSYQIGIGDLLYSKVNVIINPSSSVDQDFTSIIDGAPDSMNSITGSISDSSVLDRVKNGSLVAKTMVNMLTEVDWIYYILLLSLSLGVLAFLFSLTSKIHR